MSEIAHYMEAASRLRDERDAALARLDAAEERLRALEEALAGYYGTHNYTRLDTGQEVRCGCRLCQRTRACLPAAGEGT